MALNIKNREVEKLAQEISDLTGETKTEAIRKALEERKARLRTKVLISPGQRARRFLEEEVWPRLEGRTAPTKAEVEAILGYGELGV